MQAASAPPLDPPPYDGLEIKQPQQQQQQPDRFETLVRRHELAVSVSEQLRQILANCVVVALLDDSGSMSTLITNEDEDRGNPKAKAPLMTRWQELRLLAKALVEFVTSVNPAGMDVYFLNRKQTLRGVKNESELKPAFANPPDGNTPLSTALLQIYNDKKAIIEKERQVLILVVTDGKPTDAKAGQDPISTLFDTLQYMTACGNVHVSVAECTDQSVDMDHLDEWNGKIRNFDNTDDFRREQQRVHQIKGADFKFDYDDYVVKILLATFLKWYFNLDQQQQEPNVVAKNAKAVKRVEQDSECCRVM